jgi:hypothetical protein
MSAIANIISKFDNRGVKDAQKAFSSLGSSMGSLKKLAAGLGVGISLNAIKNAALDAISAAKSESIEMTRLATSLKNVGAGFATSDVENFITKMALATGVSDNQLRPALIGLINTTQDYQYSQKLLTTAMNVSAGTGKDLTEVTAALQKAYLGNFAALGRMGASITKATLASGDFNKILDQLNTRYAGQAEAAANTMAGSMNKVSVATQDAKESIGFGLMDALRILATDGSGNVDQFATSIENAGTKIGDFFRGTALGFKAIGDGISNARAKSAELDNWLKGFTAIPRWIGGLFADTAAAGAAVREGIFSIGEISGREMQKMDYERFQADNRERARAEYLLGLKKKQATATKAQLSLEQQIAQALAGRAGLVLTKDIQAVELYAASQLKFAQNTELIKQYMDAQNVSLADAQIQMAALRDKGYDVAGIYALIATNALNAAEATKKVADNLATVATPTQAAVTAPSTIPAAVMAAAPQAPQSYANIPEVGTNMAQIQTGGGLTGVFTQQQPVVNNNTINMTVDSTDAAQKVMDIINSKLRAGASFYNNLSN